MYTALLHSHNLFRWLILVLFLIALFFSLNGWLQKKDWSKKDRITGSLLSIFMDIQLLIGLVLYFFVSPLTKSAFADFGAAMKNSGLRFFAVEHIFLMVLAVVFVHIGKAKTKKAGANWKNHRSAFIWFGLSLVLILLGIPWDRAMF
jgi:protein-S-isoprenylcysteine O-methyltransferase Ste14